MRTFWTNLLSAGSAVLTAGIVAFATPAAANASINSVPRATVAFNQADAATPSGRAAIERRIRIAAASICQTGDAGQQIAESRCRGDAVAQAERDLDAPSSPAIQVAAG